MGTEYLILNACIQELNRSNLQLVNRLRIEIRLIQLKRMLLDEHLLNQVKLHSPLVERLQSLLSLIGTMCRVSDDQQTEDLVRAEIEALALFFNPQPSFLPPRPAVSR